MAVKMDFQSLSTQYQRLMKEASAQFSELQSYDDIAYQETPSEVVAQMGTHRLRRYFIDGKAIHPGPPLLIVYALINRHTILDLDPEWSLIRRLCEQYGEVYLIDWCAPSEDAALEDACLQHYIETIHQAVRHLHDGIEQPVDLLGVCQGGSLSLCYTALHPDLVGRLITMITPVDFHTQNDIVANLTRNMDFAALQQLLGSIPGELIRDFFTSLKPVQLGMQKYLDAVSDDSESGRRLFLLVEKWMNDTPSLAGCAAREFVTQCFKENRLVQGTMEIGGRQVDLQAITQPILNIYAEKDHIVPPAASQALAEATRSDHYTEQSYRTGHIGIYISRKSVEEVPALIQTWRSETAM